MSDILYEGKSKLVCRGRGEKSFLIKHKDTATAFNGEKKEELSGKGKLNAAISNMIFGYLEENGVKTHLIEVIDDTSALVKKRRSSWLKSLSEMSRLEAFPKSTASRRGRV